jgi:hypothetical protein
MRTRRFALRALSGLAVLLAGFGWTGEDPDTDTRVFRPGDRAVVLGRLAHCPSWSDRPLDLQAVPESGAVTLIKISGFELLGKSPKAASRLLVQRSRERFPERVEPHLRVALVRDQREYESAILLFGWSLKASSDRICPTGPERGGPRTFLP